MTMLPDDSKSQIDKFKEAARDLDCDDDPVRFDAMVKKIATAPKSNEKKEGSDQR